MLETTPRRTWCLACAACLAAAALMWPGQDAARPGLPMHPGAAEVPPPAEALAGDVGEPSSDAPVEPGEATATQDFGELGDGSAEAEQLLDAVADAPLRGSWTSAAGGRGQASTWKAYWGVTPRQAAEVPVTRKPVPAFQRAPQTRRAPATVQAEPRGAVPKAPASGPALGRPMRVESRAGSWLSPEAVSRRMGRLMERIKAYQAASRAWAQRHGAARGAGGSGARSRAAGAPRSAEPAAKAKAGAKALPAPKLRPVLLSRLLGLRAIRPPKGNIKVPDLGRLARLAPRKGPDGKPLEWLPARPGAVEAARPLAKMPAGCRKGGAHWHPGPPPLYHAKQTVGLWQGDGGLWLEKAGSRWWAWTAPGQPTWLWSAGHWWWRSQGVWFLLHQGQAWGYRAFSEYQAEGLVHPGTGAQMVYSADGRRAALITPGDGAWLFDAGTGAVMERWSEAQMPKRPRPRAPKSLSLPR